MQRDVLITDLVDDLLIDGLAKAGYNVVYNKDIAQPEVDATIQNYTGIVVTTKIGLTAGNIRDAVKLKWIARAGSGMDHVDVNAAAQKGIACICSPEGNAGSVGEHCVAMLLSILRRVPEANAATRAFTWQTDEYRVTELEGMTIGILGYGHTGPAFARRLQGFGVDAIAYDKYKTGFNDAFAKSVTLNELFERSDALSVHLPLTTETRRMIDTDFINRFKKDIYFVNTSRGNIAAVGVLLDALNAGKIKRAAVDVLDNENFETLSDDDKRLYASLLNHPHLLITPHVAGKSSSTRRRHASVLLAKILDRPEL